MSPFRLFLFWKVFASCSSLVLLLAASGCSQKRTPITGPYRFERVGPQEMLTPPGTTRTSDLVLNKARRPRRKGCDITGVTFQLTWKGRTATLKADRKNLEQAGRVAVTLLDEIDRFRERLLALETNGCLKPGEAGPVLDGIVEGLALPSRVLFYFRHGTSVQTGFVDLRPPFRMKIVAPLKEGGQTLGFETAWYRMDKGRPMIERVESYRQGKLTVTPKPSTAIASMSSKARWYRLFFLTRRSAADHDILLIAARTPKDLDDHTAQVRKDPEAACRALRGFCFAVPSGMAISGELPVGVGDQLRYASISGTVGEVLRNAGAPNARKIRVRRPHRGQLTDVAVQEGIDVRTLVIIGGEQITYQP
ncbi:MAG: hypothetical protein JNK87_26890 [Bryobacterales bacterium]|nr:hypothetical protein [Bryobacterales bacterium]